jgi:hypothetical protein
MAIKSGAVVKALMVDGETLAHGMAEWKRLTADEKADLIRYAEEQGGFPEK